MTDKKKSVVDYLSKLPKESSAGDGRSLKDWDEYVDKLIEDEAGFEAAVEMMENNEQYSQERAFSVLNMILYDK